GGAPQYETDRARFIGRGRDVRRPRALEGDAPLSGTVGNVLDPVVSLRREVVLEGGESATLVAVLAAGADKKAVLAAVARMGGGASMSAGAGGGGANGGGGGGRETACGRGGEWAGPFGHGIAPRSAAT